MPNQTTVGWGILGSGNVLKKIGTAFSLARNVKLVAIASRNQSRAQIIAQTYGAAKAYEGYNLLLHDAEVDVVLVALHNGLHCEWTVKALEAGKHVLCEKPLACNPAEVELMFAEADRNNKMLMEGFMYRFHPQILDIKNRILQGDIGDIRHIRTSYISRGPSLSNPRYWKNAGGGALMDLGCYCVNLCRFFMGEEPRQVYGAALVDEDSDVDTMTSGILNFSGDVSASFLCGFQAEGLYGAEIVGTKGKIALPHPWLPPSWPTTYEIVQFSVAEKVQVHSSLVPSHYLAPFVAEIEYFSSCIRDGSYPQFPPGEDARMDSCANAQVLDALRLATRTRQKELLVW